MEPGKWVLWVETERRKAWIVVEESFHNLKLKQTHLRAHSELETVQHNNLLLTTRAVLIAKGCRGVDIVVLRGLVEFYRLPPGRHGSFKETWEMVTLGPSDTEAIMTSR